MDLLWIYCCLVVHTPTQNNSRKPVPFSSSCCCSEGIEIVRRKAFFPPKDTIFARPKYVSGDGILVVSLSLAETSNGDVANNTKTDICVDFLSSLSPAYLREDVVVVVASDKDDQKKKKYGQKRSTANRTGLTGLSKLVGEKKPTAARMLTDLKSPLVVDTYPNKYNRQRQIDRTRVARSKRDARLFSPLKGSTNTTTSALANETKTLSLSAF